jgi:hypothetical protein
MAVLIMVFGHDQLSAASVNLFAENRLQTGYGYRTDMGPWQKRWFGTFSSGSVRVGGERRSFSCVRLDKDVGALGVAVKLGYTSGNSILVATAIEEQVAIMKSRKINMDSGYALFARAPVPMLSEYGNALLITGNPEAGELAATVLRRFVFPETVSRKPYVPKTTPSRGVIHDIPCVEDCHV